MKKFLTLAVVLGLAACAPKENAAPAVDSTASTIMPSDTMHVMDSTKMDTTHVKP